ncbi:hypothetical protein [Leptospira yanagawae]|uniref:Uncharacterized protein n=1 Tax=Leptospira yanagawae TaxID=293069 RepID=A0ABY2M2Y9_9LEPT|nr:hypothetical protein [Leptospira yanagawae]TGL20973.1 hypothetical protein EHQ46_10815 [Leptospira yanagawae]
MELSKKSLLFSLVFSLAVVSISAQDTKPQTTPTDVNQENHDAKEGQDKELFEYYYKTRPENLPPNKAKLEYNLIKTLKKEIMSRDYSKESAESIKKIDATNIQYERVYRESKWLRGFMTQNTHLNYMEFMYVVKYDKYMCFVTFDVNPENYLQQSRQSQLVFAGKDKFEITIPKP